MYEADIEEVKDALLLYSGGLDTSAMLLWLQDQGIEVTTLTVDLGQGEDLNAIKKRAVEFGAKDAIVVDAKKEFVENYIKPSILANGLYMGKYPMATSLGRPLLAIKAVELAKKLGISTIVHGSTGSGNDQVRKEVMIMALAPELKILAPVRKFKFTRAKEAEIIKEHGFEPPAVHKDYSTDENLWGLSFQGSELYDPKNPASDKVYEGIKKYFPTFNKPEDAPSPVVVSIGFNKGVPVSLNGKAMPLEKLIAELNSLGAKYGIGLIDYVENYIFGHKGREFYIAPAATILISAHNDLEHLLFPKQLLLEKLMWDLKWSYLAYHGMFEHKLMKVLQGAITQANEPVTGEVQMKLSGGSAMPIARSSPNATSKLYGSVDFDEASPGFIELFGLEARL